MKELLVWCISATLVLSGCVTAPQGSSSPAVGPGLSSSYGKKPVDQLAEAARKIDIVIPVFDPGLPEAQAAASGYDDETHVWPDLRRAEANRFALKLKEALEATGAFGAVRVTPDATASGDLYLLGTIGESNGAEIEFDLKALDSSGRQWFDEEFEHEVTEAFFHDQRNQGKDPYDPAFDAAAEYVVKQLVRKSAAELETLQQVTELRFGASFSEEAFAPYLSIGGGRVELASLPSEQDPMLRRVRAIRVRDQLFVDRLQSNYESFSQSMEQSYLIWQEQSLAEVLARREAESRATTQAVGGIALIGLAILSAVAGSRSDSRAGQTAGTAGAVVGGLAAAKLLTDSFQTSEEAEIHREALNELGRSIDLEIAPQVIAFEEENVQLTGDAREQFQQWRAFLAKMYALEKTPERKL